MTHTEIDKYMNVIASNIKRIFGNDVMELVVQDPVITYNKIHERFRIVESSNLYNINTRRHYEPFIGLTKKLLRADYASADLSVWIDYLKDDDNYQLFADGVWKNHNDIVKRQLSNIDAASKQYGWNPDDAQSIMNEYNSIILAIDDDWQDLLSIFGSCFENVKYSDELIRLFKGNVSLLHEFVTDCKKYNYDCAGVCEKYKSFGGTVTQSWSTSGELIGKTLFDELEKLKIIHVKYRQFMNCFNK
jgi:hypothetical protein